MIWRLSFLSCTAPVEYVVVLKNMFMSRLCFLCPPSSLAYEGASCIFWNCFSLAKAADTLRFSAKLTDVLCSPSRPHLTTIVGVSSHCHQCLPVRAACFVFVHRFVTAAKLQIARNVSCSNISAAASSVAANFYPSHDKHFQGGMRVSWGVFVCSEASQAEHHLRKPHQTLLSQGIALRDCAGFLHRRSSQFHGPLEQYVHCHMRKAVGEGVEEKMPICSGKRRVWMWLEAKARFFTLQLSVFVRKRCTEALPHCTAIQVCC